LPNSSAEQGAAPKPRTRQKTTTLCEPIHMCSDEGPLNLSSLAISAHLTLGVERGSQMSTIKLIAVGLGIGLLLAAFTNFFLDAALAFATLIS
jgi:hypothetical protein